jgi:hypothetical protein
VPLPRFLIDENLSVELPAIAHAAGFEAQHVNQLGLRARGDPVLMRRILDENWMLVTNNWREFLARYRARAPLHEGLVLLVAASGIEEQKLAFRLAILTIRRCALDLMNTALFIERDGDRLTARIEPWPDQDPE